MASHHIVRLNPDGKGKHDYEIGVQRDGQISRVSVFATNRDQAARIAVKSGYVVRDVNMVG